ncbi:MAG TPA: type I restriction endonuclease [Methanoculleus sp.]|jgi:type I restriction enzyme R subunit|uniref:type I restriction endonuclease n=1 Tax=Methanoculleus sp. TaxID=90427 RepID=UPI002B88D502|nr:type I restriction endonuclease [Methanoculleus sp.]HOC85110.1 type I restriction endonuclease [Methanoculleus sp.]HOF97532.1 type I restriction endonuclease [Methanoculleus sp.]HOI62177.1 type I restriction endonuclease [Methanoculleus sp.]HOS68161.1 type I restriction endonuclease [Methanoculleus sp.]HQC34573.1 type I restriction endonuclease [Methanoculleus sp.]
MTFTEANTVEQLILDAVTRKRQAARLTVQEAPRAGSPGDIHPAGWTYVPAREIPRRPGDVMVESWLRDALIRLNPRIAAEPGRADEVIYNLRAILLAVQADGLVRANENFMAWLRGEKTMPFGKNGEHVPVRLVDADNPGGNHLVVTNQWTYPAR